MKLGKKFGSFFDDRIDIEVSPSQLKDLIYLTEQWSLDNNGGTEDTYGAVGIQRKLKDLLQERFDTWQEERGKRDEGE